MSPGVKAQQKFPVPAWNSQAMQSGPNSVL